MPTYSEKQTFYAYRNKDGALATPLYDGQAPATKKLLDKLENWGTAEKFHSSASYSYDKKSEYQRAYKAWRKGIRDAARELAKGYTLVTFCLVQFVDPKQET